MESKTLVEDFGLITDFVVCSFGPRTNARRENRYFIVDNETYKNYVEKYKFCLNDSGYAMYSGTKDGLHKKKLHRIIMDEPVGLQVDHINRIRFDNRRDNLRIQALGLITHLELLEFVGIKIEISGKQKFRLMVRQNI